MVDIGGQACTLSHLNHWANTPWLEGGFSMPLEQGGLFYIANTWWLCHLIFRAVYRLPSRASISTQYGVNEPQTPFSHLKEMQENS